MHTWLQAPGRSRRHPLEFSRRAADTSPMSIADFQREICRLLLEHGWIEGFEEDPQDLRVEWTALGREKADRFLDEVQALRADRPFDARELADLRAFGIHLGVVEATRRDRTLQALRPFTGGRNLLVVSTAPSGHRRLRLFTARDFAGFYDYLEAQEDDDREVMLISIEDILASNVGRVYPFGARRTEGAGADDRARGPSGEP